MIQAGISMTKLLIIRHGQSQANLDGIFVGHVNSPLSELGVQQAKLTADYIVSNYHVDAVYASDLERAFYTGKCIADILNLPITADDQLREIYAGDWERVKFDDLAANYGEPYQLWLRDIGRAKCQNGESVAQLQERFVSAVRRIAEENEGKTVVIASHATPIRTFMTHCAGCDITQMKNIPWVSNASVTIVEYDHNVFRIVTPGYDKHLGDLRTALPKNV